MALYLHEYPLLIGQITRLVKLVRDHDPNVALLALFGSTARLTPHRSSDADLLVLVHDLHPFHPYSTGCPIAPVLRLLGQAEDAPDGLICRWHFSVVSGSTRGDDIDEEFLENVAEHGVLLYQQEGASIPAVLESLQPLGAWLERVHSLLTHYGRRQSAAVLVS